MTIAIPILLTIIGVALVSGRKSSPWSLAIIFTMIGIWLGRTWVGNEVVAGFDYLAQIIG